MADVDSKDEFRIETNFKSLPADCCYLACDYVLLGSDEMATDSCHLQRLARCFPLDSFEREPLVTAREVSCHTNIALQKNIAEGMHTWKSC
jgi:hypothetical protein